MKYRRNQSGSRLNLYALLPAMALLLAVSCGGSGGTAVDSATDPGPHDTPDYGRDALDGDVTDTQETEPEPCITYYKDTDEDGFGTEDFQCLLAPQAPYTATQSGDCDDADGDVFPGRAEDCQTDWDDNCNEQVNEQDALNCIGFFADVDEDGFYPDGAVSQCWCLPVTGFSGEFPGDCDDTKAYIYPGRDEDCDTDWDDNCNDETNEQDALGCVIFFEDQDEDGFYPDGAQSQCWCLSVTGITGEVPGDCDDQTPDVNPEGMETCNGLDDDCDGDTDADLCPMITYYCDGDEDLHFSQVFTGACDEWNCMPQGCQDTPGDDCADGEALVHPDMEESCNGMDDNCAGGADEGDVCPVLKYHCDLDDDQHVSQSPSGSCAIFGCVPDGCAVDPGGDCNDKNALIHSDAAEECNGIDDNCSQGADEENTCPTLNYYCDKDADHHLSSTPTGTCSAFECVPMDCEVTPGGDCNDNARDINPDIPDVCNGIDDDCMAGPDDGGICPTIAYYCDGDDDGYPSTSQSGTCASFYCAPENCSEVVGTDCNDNAPHVNPGIPETCNGIDDDCQLGVDDTNACPTLAYFCDLDDDGHLSLAVSGTCDTFQCLPQDCLLAAGEDCNDKKAQVNPEMAETCNGVDDNCIDGADEGGVCPIQDYFCDTDQDGHVASTITGTCSTFDCLPEGCQLEPGMDCIDTNAAVNPDALEVCNGLDDDCKDGADAGTCPEIPYYCDKDIDGYESLTPSGLCSSFNCVPSDCHDVAGDDCNDNNVLVNPGVEETCNGMDDDCSGEVDDGDACPLDIYYCDEDSDGFFSLTASGSCSAFECTPAECQALAGEDCNDNNGAVNPLAAEICNGIDDNCKDGVDENDLCIETTYYCDVDDDGFTSTEVSGICGGFSCLPQACEVDPGTDCNDSRPLVNPDATEDCDTAYDDDCDGMVNDVDGLNCQDWFEDQDDDGFHADGAPSQCRCGPGDGYITQTPGDCDDGEATVHEGALEICDGLDNDCDDATDEDDICTTTTYYCDLDTDLHVAVAASGACNTPDCVPEGCETAPGDDCDDDNPSVNPNAAEDCDTAFDDDCNGLSDEEDALHCTVFHRDLDEDGFGHLTDTKCLCQATHLYAVSPDGATDCNDNNLNIHPLANEACNGMDDNCDGQTDEGFVCPFVTYYCDLDEDGYESEFLSGVCSAYNCVPAGCSTQTGDDCNDNNPLLNPGVDEQCNGFDDNCNGAIDEDDICPPVPFHCDLDGDGWVSSTLTGTCQTFDCIPVGCQAEAGLDCLDNEADIHPEAAETCNGVDENCSGEIDEGGVCPETLFYCDKDGDMFVAQEVTGSCQFFQCIPVGCMDSPGDDCNDNNPDANPLEDEACNGMDDNCDGQTDEGFICPFVTYYCDHDEDGHHSDFLSGVCNTYNCMPPGCQLFKGDDCNDNDQTIHAGAEEICNGIDDNCAEGVDEGDVCPPVPFHCDLDGDGWLSQDVSGICNAFECIPFGCEGAPGPDCNDNDDGIHPDAVETCDGVDENCQGEIDEGDICPEIFYYCDQDGDLHIAEDVSGSCKAFQCVPLGCQDTTGDDCNDNNTEIHPQFPEACNGIDDNCEGQVDEDGICPPVPFYCDNDGDQHVATQETGICAAFQCIPVDCQGNPGGDCNDNVPEINPDITETCNGIDDDCTGVIDDDAGCPLLEFYCDMDGDLYVSLAISDTCQTYLCMPPYCYDTPGPDCNDEDPWAHPGAKELCNGVDEDCDGTIDNHTCTIDGLCWEALQPNPTDGCLLCDPDVNPTGWTDYNGAACDDGYEATVNDICLDGVCAGELAPCFDGLPFHDALRIQSLLLGDDGNPGQGLNIDDDLSTCMPAGTYSDGSPICSEGIDNKFALVDILVNSELPKAFESGTIHIIMEFQDWSADGSPFVLAMHNGRLEPPESTCDFTQPGCEFIVAIDSFDAQCNPSILLSNATINGTQLTAGGSGHQIVLEMPLIGDTVVTLTIQMARLEGTVTIDGSSITAFSGILAGAFSKDELFAAVNLIPEEKLPMPKQQIYSLMNLLLVPDIDVDGDGTNESISLGMLAEADQAVITGFYY